MRVCGYCGDIWRGGYGFAKDGIDLKFCRPACFHRWEAKLKFIPDEIEAIQRSLPAVGKHVADAGFGAKPFNDLTKDEALGLVANCVRSFRVELEKVFAETDIPF